MRDPENDESRELETERAARALFVIRRDIAEVLSDTLGLLASRHELRPSAVYIFDERQGVLVPAATHAMPVGSSTSFPMGEGLVGEVAASQEARCIEGDGTSFDLDTGVGKLTPAAILAAPLVSGERLLGVIVLASLRPLEPRSLAFLERISEGLSSWLDDILLYREASEKAEQLNERARRLEARNVELERRGRETSERLANMSHEIRGPLNSIIGFSEMLERGLAGPLEEKQQKYASQIFQSGEQLLDLVQHLTELRTGRETAPEDSLESPAGEPAGDERAESSKPASIDAEESAVEEAAESPPQVGSEPDETAQRVLVVEDEECDQQLLRSYLETAGYAVQIASDGKQALQMMQEAPPDVITLDLNMPEMDGVTFLQELAESPSEQTVPVVVLSGCEFPENRSAIGADAYMSKPVDRTKLLGLLQTLFEGDEEPVGGAKRVLVVDDNPRAVKLITAFLHGRPYELHSAYNGREALALVSSVKPDVILLDVMMPEVNGFDVISELKAKPETAEIPIVVLTGKQLTEDEQEYLKSTVALVAKKQDIREAHLLREIRRVTGRRRKSRR